MNATLYAPLLKRLPRLVYKAAAQAYIDKDYPRHLFIETTAACNLTCTYCPREKRTDAMDFRCFTHIIDEASTYGARSFSLHLFGEPLLYARWQDAIAYIQAKNRRHSVLLTTNGTVLNARVDDLIAANPDLVLWSWRPEAKFTQATKDKLRKWGKFRVRFIAEVTPKEAYLEWADWSNVEGRSLHNYAGNVDLSQFNAPMDTGTARWPCYHLWLAPAVAWNGNILLCCADPHQKEVLGHFPEQTVAQVWQGERLKAIRQEHLQGEYKGICSNCDVWKSTPDLFFNFQKH